jgi:hypothetical protein
MRRTTPWVFAALITAQLPRAAACGTCGCGDPTLTAFGTEKPFENRLRASLELRLRSEEIGRARVDQISMQEGRLDGHLAWAPHERVFLLLTAPLIRREVRYVNEAKAVAAGLGDVELRLKGFVAQDAPAFPRHLLAINAGLRLPTAPRQERADGTRLPMEMQMGSGSWDPLLGVSYAYFLRPWSLYASLQGSMPLRDTSTFRASPSLRSSLSVQRQFSLRFALRLGIDTRVDAKSYEGGEPERDSGGFVGFLSPDLLLGLADDLLAVASVRVPVVQALAGYHREHPLWGMGLSYDL